MDNQNNQQPQSMGGAMPGMKKSHGVGPAVGIVIIIVLLIAGGYYFWQQRAATMKGADLPSDEVSVDQDDTRAALEAQGSSDELADIEQDLNATELDSIDEELINVEQEVNI